MAHPKHRISKARRDKRRANDSLTPAQLSTCPNCGATVKYHTVCPECGQYRGKQAIEKDITA